jgi:hypothetical protein
MHPFFHKLLDQEPFKAQTLTSNHFHDYRGPHYAVWRVGGSMLRGDSTIHAHADQFFDLTTSKGPTATSRGDSIVPSESDCFFGSTTSRAPLATSGGDSMVASREDCLVGLTRARAAGATPHGDTARLSNFKLLPRHLTL